MKQTKLLIILDGWGYSKQIEHNAIALANTPTWGKLLVKFSHTLINTSGTHVGLLGNQMGNSEVGHLNIGSGRVVSQELSRIHKAIDNGEFFHNIVLKNQFKYAAVNNKAVHIIGLISDGGVHSHLDHIKAMLKMAQQNKCSNVYLHLFTDGRDCPPKSAIKYINIIEAEIDKLKIGRIATIIGRYYAMDRDNRWDRTRLAFELIMGSNAKFTANSANEAIESAYSRGESDEFINSTVIKDKIVINKNDVIICINYRADRVRQITQAFIDNDFNGFSRGVFAGVQYCCLTEYKKTFNVPTAFPSMKLNNVLGKYLSNLGKLQLRIAETEKYAHVTFFLNGGVEEPFIGEDRIIIPSPNVATYDLQPEMSAYKLTDELIIALKSNKYDLIICNYANTDMVGHSGKLAPAIQAVETIDNCLSKLYKVIDNNNYEAIITADHGNVEKMFDVVTNTAHTAHTSNPVPLLLISKTNKLSAKIGALSDIAPTILQMMELDKPIEMSGKSLLL